MKNCFLISFFLPTKESVLVVLGRVVSNGISDNRWGNITTEESNKRYLEEIILWLEENDLNLDKENVIKILKEWQRL